MRRQRRRSHALNALVHRRPWHWAIYPPTMLTSFVAVLLLLTSVLHGPRQPNVFIQPATACPISSGESSWTKWTPLTVTSVCARRLRACSRTLPPARIPPGSAFRKSLGTLLVFSHSA